MDDELEDRIFYQTYISHMKILSKFVVGLPLNTSHLVHIWKMLRLYVIKPEVLFLGILLIFFVFYLHSVEIWSRSLVNKIRLSFGRAQSRQQKLQYFNNDDLDSFSWDIKDDFVAAYAIQGRRPQMEDRFDIHENINMSGVTIFAVFDGHGGKFAVNFARNKLISNLKYKIAELNKLKANGGVEKQVIGKPPPSPKLPPKKNINIDRKPSLRSTEAEDVISKSGPGLVTDPVLLEKLDSLPRVITREVKPMRSSSLPRPPPELSSYLENNNTINYGRLLTDEVLAVDTLLVEKAKQKMDVAGTTALIAILEGSKLIVANVGDSRGVMCNSKGKAIPLSFDHKPQQTRERRRIAEAGGTISFNGVWRVAGILATSRALGDYPLKERKLVIADPDILTFDLKDHKPEFLILATDGLWDTFSNEEAVAFIRSHLHEPHFGAKSITLQSYYRGSLDNITVMVVNFIDHKWT